MAWAFTHAAVMYKFIASGKHHDPAYPRTTVANCQKDTSMDKKVGRVHQVLLRCYFKKPACLGQAILYNAWRIRPALRRASSIERRQNAALSYPFLPLRYAHSSNE